MNAPCKGCEYREVACHVKCPAYRMFKRKREETLKCEYVKNDITSYVESNFNRIRRKIGKPNYRCTVND